MKGINLAFVNLKISIERNKPTEIKSTKSEILKPTEGNSKTTENDSTKLEILKLENGTKVLLF